MIARSGLPFWIRVHTMLSRYEKVLCSVAYPGSNLIRAHKQTSLQAAAAEFQLRLVVMHCSLAVTARDMSRATYV